MGVLLRQFVRDEHGATSIEYALIAGGISIVILAAVTAVGNSVNSSFTSVAAAVK
jgi:pilus assembly protein Flp/PilA